jgi:hypothetical protein
MDFEELWESSAQERPSVQAPFLPMQHSETGQYILGQENYHFHSGNSLLCRHACRKYKALGSLPY